MKKIEVSELTENFFETISKEWMLVCAGDANRYNMMTASWGGIGWLWNKPVAFVFIRPERYTFEFTENNDFMTLSFLGKSSKAREGKQGGYHKMYIVEITGAWINVHHSINGLK